MVALHDAAPRGTSGVPGLGDPLGRATLLHEDLLRRHHYSLVADPGRDSLQKFVSADFQVLERESQAGELGGLGRLGAEKSGEVEPTSFEDRGP